MIATITDDYRAGGLTFTRGAIGLLIIVAGIALLPDGVVAADYSKEQLRTFKKNLAAGTEAYNDEDFETALQKYLAAREAIDEPRLTYRIALTYEKLERCRKAKSAYDSFIKKTEGTKELGAQRTSAKKKLETLEKQCPPTGTLAIRCDPEGASVSVDGETQSCPAELTVEAGDYDLKATADGYQAATSTVTVNGGETTNTKLVLTPVPDGQAGDDDGQRPAWRRYGPWVGIGAGAVLIGGGLITDASAVGRADELQTARENNNTSRIQNLRDEAQAAQTRTWVFYGSGLALAAGGAIWYIVDRPSPETAPDTASLRPTIGPTSVGLQINW